MTIALCVSIPVVIVALVGSIIDAAGSNYFKKNLACTNGNGQLSGYSNLFSNATYCYNKKVGFNNYTTTPNPTTYNCYCADNINDCIYLNTKYQSRCNLIFSTYSPTLTVGSVFDFLAFLAILTFSIITCCSVCCPQNFRENDVINPYAGTYPVVYGVGGVNTAAVATASVGKQPVVYGTVVPPDGTQQGQTELYGKAVQPAYSPTVTGGVVYGNVVQPPPPAAGDIRY